MTNLIHNSDLTNGYGRKISDDSISYFEQESSEIVTDNKIIKRLNQVAVPPSYSQVEYARNPKNYLQATGQDANNQKQYFYHPDWEEKRQQQKFDQLPTVAKALPRVRRQVSQTLKSLNKSDFNNLSREVVLAGCVRLLDQTAMRIGSAEYSNDNETFGLSTLRRRHVLVESDKITFCYQGKDNVLHEHTVSNSKLLNLITTLIELPGYEVFKYKNKRGELVDVSAGDVNQYLTKISASKLTAKDFRTWHGTAKAVGHCVKCAGEEVILKDMYKTSAEFLHNTPATARDYYIHPAVIEFVKNNNSLPSFRASKWLSKEEVLTKKLLK